MKDNNKIVMIPRSLLHAHPDNPRKDLGDLKELADSIAEHGIMQNLTVVPDEGDGDGYKILIGHRRFAASEGVLDELPCVVAKGLTDREQVGIMLCENMQRSDLTYLEQAHGFQMMMDLGDTIETISEKTGFSKATVKHRLAINELDQSALNEAKKWFQPTIADFIALEKVKDLELRNQILSDSMCSKDIQDGVDDYLEDAEVEENFAYYKKYFDEAGWIEETKDIWFYYRDGYKEVDNALRGLEILHKTLLPEKTVKKLISEVKGEVHYSLNNNRIKVATYKEPKSKKGEEDREKARKEAEKLKKKNKAALKEIRADICDAYMDFIQNSQYEPKSPQQELGNVYLLLDLCREFGMGVTLYMLTAEKVRYQLHDKLSLKGYNKEDYFKDFESWTPLFQLLTNIWWSLASSYNCFEDYDCCPKKEILEAHKSFCNILKDIDGFRIKDEWKPVLDGTSELYEKGGK